jgi:hypothetical protein
MLHSCRKCGEAWEGEYIRNHPSEFDEVRELGEIIGCPACIGIIPRGFIPFFNALSAYQKLLELVRDPKNNWQSVLTADFEVYFFRQIGPDRSLSVYVWDLTRVRIVEYEKGEVLKITDGQLDQLQIVEESLVFVSTSVDRSNKHAD